MTPAERLLSLSRLALTMSEDTAAIERAASVIVEAVQAGGTVYVCGNGGSFAQAQHFAAEMTGRYKRERRPVAAIALGSNGAHLTAVSNDYEYSEAFAREVEALAREGDVIVGLTTSGKSPSIFCASNAAHFSRGKAKRVMIVGQEGRNRCVMSDALVVIPSTDTALIQEATLSVLHSICEAIDEAIE